MGVDLTLELVVQRMIVTGTLLIKNNQVGAEPAHLPIGMRQQQLANQRHRAGVGDDHREYGEIAGNSIAPQCGLSQPVPLQPHSRHSKVRISVEQVAGEFLETVTLCRTDSEVPKL